MPFTLSIPCTDCDARRKSLELQHFKVLSCDPDPNKPNFCVLKFEDPVVGDGAGAAPLAFAGKAAPLSLSAVDHALTRLNVEPAALWAIVKVETSGCGFLADRRPQILFERHKFSAATGGRFDKDAPDISSPTMGGWIGGSAEYARLTRAMDLDPVAAMQSTSWGLGQIMGSNAKAAGFADVAAMVRASAQSEDQQLAAMTSFIASEKLDAAMRAKDWAKLAQFYNGKSYKDHDYDGQLRRFHEFFTTHPLPELRVREAQLALLFLGYAPQGSVDGVYGKRTDDALARFAHDQGLQVGAGNKLSDELLQRLRVRVGWAAA